MSEQASERVSRRVSEQVGAGERKSKEIIAGKTTGEQCEQKSKQTSESPDTYVLIKTSSGPACFNLAMEVRRSNGVFSNGH